MNYKKDKFLRFGKIALVNILMISLFAFIVFSSAATVMAGDTTNSSGSSGFTNPIKATSLDSFLTDLLKVVTTIGAVVVVLFLILAGFKYVTARGDLKKIQEATNTLTWTVVGAMVLLGAQVIATAIQGTINELK